MSLTRPTVAAAWRRLCGGGGATGNVFRNMLVLAAGTGMAKAIGTLSIPVITRLYDPEQYGLFTLFLSLTALLTPLVTLRYSAALPLPRARRLALNLLLSCVVILVLSVLVLAAALAIFGETVFRAFSIEALAPYWPLLVVSVALAGLYEILQSWTLRRRAFGLMAKADVTQSVLGSALKIGLALVSMPRLGLIAGHLGAQAAACALIASQFSRRSVFPGSGASFKWMRYCLARFSDFPRYRLPSQLLLAFSVQAPLFYVGAEFGPAVAGQLGLALVALAVPINLVGQSTGQAYYSEIARIGRANPRQIQLLTRGVAKRLLILGLVPSVALMFGAQYCFPLFFGAEWHDAGVFASILSIYLLMQFVANPLGHVLSVLERQALFLGFNAVRALIVVGVFAASHHLGLSATMAVGLYSVALALHYLFVVISVFRVIRHRVDQTPPFRIAGSGAVAGTQA